MTIDVAAVLAHVHGPWVYTAVVLAALLESAAFIGLVVPGETILLLAGATAALGGVDVLAVLGCGVLGAVLGDQIGYLLGRTMTGTVRRRTRATPGWPRAEAFVARRGGPAVFLARWVGVLRAVVPAVAGAVGMPRRTFTLWNVVGGASWATAVVLIGFAAGAAGPTVIGWFGAGTTALVAVGVAIALIGRVVRRRRRADGGGPDRSSGTCRPVSVT